MVIFSDASEGGGNMAEEKKFNIQESRIFSVKRDDEQVIKFPIDTKWVEQINTLPFFIVEKESGGYDLFELTDDNQLFGVLLNCNKILLPSELTEDNKYLLAYQKKGEENIRLWSMEKRCELLKKIEMSAIYLEETLNGFVPILTRPFQSKSNTCLVEIETGEEIYRSDSSDYHYLAKTDTEFYEIKDPANRLCGLINTETRTVLAHIEAIAFFASKDYLFVCEEHEVTVYKKCNFKILALLDEYFDKSAIEDVCHTAWDNNVFVHYSSYQGRPITHVTMVFAHNWGNVFCRFTYNRKGKIFEPIEFKRDLDPDNVFDPASLSKDMDILSKALKKKEYLKW